MKQSKRVMLLATAAIGLGAVAILTRPSDRASRGPVAVGDQPRGPRPLLVPPVTDAPAAEAVANSPPQLDGPRGSPPQPAPGTGGVGVGGTSPAEAGTPRARPAPAAGDLLPRDGPPDRPSAQPPRPPEKPAVANRPAPSPVQPAEAPSADEPVIPLPLARTALAMVGADPEAEALWVQAVNDPALPPNARKDLIEDLNEDGFDDPKHVTADDVPLIASRLALIEELAPDAMDDVNYAAFAEAYKDLLNMLDKASRM
jgi:hypothetical protein